MEYYEFDDEYFEPHGLEIILDEYKEKCKSVLLADVCQEIKNLREENKTYKEKNEKLSEQFKNLDKLKSDFERNKNKIIQSAIAEYQRDALSGLRCGDTIWTIKIENITSKCPHCDGTHKITVDVAGINKDVDCPHCSYGGIITIDKIFTPVSRIISEIKTSIWNENKTFRRSVYCKEVKDLGNQYSDESVDDDEYGLNKDAGESNYYNGRIVSRDFYLSEQECLDTCKQKYEEWLSNKSE